MKKFGKFGIRWAEKIDPEHGCWYFTRWVLVAFGYGIRLHHWRRDDNRRHLHDHPWWMLIFVLRGGYTDITEQGNEHLKAGDIRLRPANHKHTVALDEGGAWTLVLTGPVIRHHGFWIEGRKELMRPLRYFSRYGHHQCE